MTGMIRAATRESTARGLNEIKCAIPRFRISIGCCGVFSMPPAPCQLSDKFRGTKNHTANMQKAEIRISRQRGENFLCAQKVSCRHDRLPVSSLSVRTDNCRYVKTDWGTRNVPQFPLRNENWWLRLLFRNNNFRYRTWSTSARSRTKVRRRTLNRNYAAGDGPPVCWLLRVSQSNLSGETWLSPIVPTTGNNLL